MDFELNEEQLAVVESVQRLLDQQAGPARAIALNRDGDYDLALDSALAASGFCDIARDLGADGRAAGLGDRSSSPPWPRVPGSHSSGHLVLRAGEIARRLYYVESPRRRSYSFPSPRYYRGHGRRHEGRTDFR